jgi:hypothetical protein
MEDLGGINVLVLLIPNILDYCSNVGIDKHSSILNKGLDYTKVSIATLA